MDKLERGIHKFCLDIKLLDMKGYAESMDDPYASLNINSSSADNSTHIKVQIEYSVWRRDADPLRSLIENLLFVKNDVVDEISVVYLDTISVGGADKLGYPFSNISNNRRLKKLPFTNSVFIRVTQSGFQKHSTAIDQIVFDDCIIDDTFFPCLSSKFPFITSVDLKSCYFASDESPRRSILSMKETDVDAVVIVEEVGRDHGEVGITSNPGKEFLLVIVKSEKLTTDTTFALLKAALSILLIWSSIIIYMMQLMIFSKLKSNLSIHYQFVLGKTVLITTTSTYL
jgi:hypothetical protein